HTTHDEGERLKLAVDEAIARGDHEMEQLAIRAAAPLTAYISRPVNSTLDLPSVVFSASNVLRVRRSVPYTAQVHVSVDNGEFVLAKTVRSGQSSGGRVDVVLPEPAARPGIHVVRLKADLTFDGTEQPGTPSWNEARKLPPVFYAVYDPVAESSAPMRALVYGPASTLVRDLDPVLGDEPFAAWLSGILSARRGKQDSGPDWLSQYCDERTGEAGSRPAPAAICSVVYFQSRGDIGQIWFRTADIRETEGSGVEWVTGTPPRFEGLVIRESAQESRMLSTLPSLLYAAPQSRPVGDASIAPSDIVLSPAAPPPGTIADATITVHNIGQGDLHKVTVHVGFGTDLTVRPASRQFVVDIPAQASAELKLQVAFPNGYGFVMAHAVQVGENAPHDSWMPDPTPHDACAFRVINARLAPVRYTESLFDAAAGCSGR
ncbi:MAG: hypothetical protein H0U19_03840, partial [Acidobacteria bacterium]|nr:hypothetical protein [Acidobacteriota bacterium]